MIYPSIRKCNITYVFWLGKPIMRTMSTQPHWFQVHTPRPPASGQPRGQGPDRPPCRVPACKEPPQRISAADGGRAAARPGEESDDLTSVRSAPRTKHGSTSPRAHRPERMRVRVRSRRQVDRRAPGRRLARAPCHASTARLVRERAEKPRNTSTARASPASTMPLQRVTLPLHASRGGKRGLRSLPCDQRCSAGDLLEAARGACGAALGSRWPPGAQGCLLA